jgi:hypothetical protein
MRKGLILLVVVILAGILSQSCTKFENPESDYKYVTLYEGLFGNGIFKMSEDKVFYYTSESDFEISFVNNRDTIYKPEFSIGVKGENSIGDTVSVTTKKSNQLVLTKGRGYVVRF